MRLELVSLVEFKTTPAAAAELVGPWFEVCVELCEMVDVVKESMATSVEVTNPLICDDECREVKLVTWVDEARAGIAVSR